MTRQQLSLIRPVFSAAISLAVAVFSTIAITFLTRANQALLHKRAGDTEISNDIYGNGVRIGIYCQSFGMVISGITLNNGGIKIACSSNIIAFLLCWTKLANVREFSPAEGLLILTLIGALQIGGVPTSAVPDLDSIIGNLSMSVAIVWALVIQMWFFATLYSELPLLDTSNRGWFFVSTDIGGWYRIVQLVYASIDLILGGISALACFAGFVFAIQAQFDDNRESAEKFAKQAAGFGIAIGVYSFIPLVFSVAGAEMIIRYNDLVPQNGLDTPGQLIPLVIGVIVLIDAVFSIFTAPRRYKDLDDAL